MSAICASTCCMTRCVAITQKKGGVGKTTTALALAAIAADAGMSVGLIDLDSQGTATTGLGVAHSDAAADVLLGQLPLDDAWVETEHGILVVPSGPGTEGAERMLAADAISGLLGLRNAFAAATRTPDLVLIDTRPDEAHGVLNAYVAADEVWLVTEPVPASVEVIPRLMQTVERIGAGLNPGLRVSAIIPTKFDARTRVHTGGVAALREAFGDLVTQPIPSSVKAIEAHGSRTPLPAYAPMSSAAIAYRLVAQQLFATAGVA